MPIYKKIKGKDVKVADEKVLDHSQLSGRDAYGSHPISAIRNLPEKLTNLKNITQEIQTKASGIDIENNSDGTISLTKYNGEKTTIQSGYLPDATTIILDNPDHTFDKLTAIGLKTQGEVISGQDISDDIVNLKSVVNAKGGYLDSYDFGTATPTQEELTAYALTDIGVQTSSEIWDKTRVINTYVDNEHPDADTWVWDSHSQTWSNLGNISFVSDANNSGLHGLVTGAPNDGNHDLLGHITSAGQISINGLPEFVATTNQQLNQLTDFIYANSSVGTWYEDSTYQDYPYRGDVYLTGVTNVMIPNVVFSYVDACSGNYSPIVESFNGGISIWAKTVANVSIPLIIVEK